MEVLRDQRLGRVSWLIIAPSDNITITAPKIWKATI